jgi:uncharacterized protein
MKIRKKDKQAIIAIAKETIAEPTTILAFGSRVNGKSHDMSDLDIVIVSDKKEKIAISQLMNFKEKLQESNIPIIVQAFDWYRLPESFHKNILSGHEVMAKIDTQSKNS